MNTLLDLSLHGSLMAGVIWLLDRTLAGRMAAQGRRCWWVLVPVAFLVSIPFPVLPSSTDARPLADATSIDPTVGTGASVHGGLSVFHSSLPFWFTLWITGGVIYLLVVAVQTRAAMRRWSRIRLSTDPALLGVLEDCKAEFGITAPIGLVVSDHVSAPALMGWLRPRILLPQHTASVLSRSQLRAVLLHELAHFRSLDIPLNWLFTLARAIHWFNPVVHLVSRGWIGFREEAADETALRTMNESSGRAYGEALLAALRQAQGRTTPFGALAIGESISNLKRRLVMINHYPNRSSNSLAAILILIVLATGVILRPVRAADADAQTVPLGGTLNEVMQAMQANADTRKPDKRGLQIIQGFYGADGSWCNVTVYLRKLVKANILHVSWQQPYSEIGGDPAWPRVKTLIISYQIDGKTRLATIQEKNPPVGLEATVP